MQTRHHLLAPATPGAHCELVSLHFGIPGARPKVALQAALHADEIPGLLVAHHLRERLRALQAAGRITGEVVLVPVANPIGLGQRLLHGAVGRFDLGTGENFNRHYADLLDAVHDRVRPALGPDAAANVAMVREALLQACAALPERTPLESLRRTLLGLALDADVVLDLHCDSEAVLHLYTEPAAWPRVEPLARLMGARAVLLATESGEHPFDEACSTPWTRLAQRVGPARPVPPGCVAVTVELRGFADVSHKLAQSDAEALVAYLQWLGVIAPEAPELPDSAPAALPDLLCEPTPLAGSIPVEAPHAGVLAWQRGVGEHVRAGDVLADLVEPMTGQVSALRSPLDGLFYAREARRFVSAATSVARVAGREAVRSGRLLSE